MIDYEYPDIFITEGTQKELLITDGTVTIDGTDYEVSGETVLFENNDLELEAFELYQAINSDMQLHFGSCESARVSFVVRQNIGVDIIGTVVKVYIIPNHDASKMLQLGVFKIAEDNESQDHLKHTIIGYDAMYDILNSDVTEWYDTELPDENASTTLGALRASLLTELNITAEATILVNDSLTIKRTIDPDTLSGADVIKAICELNGVFGMITNEGKFRFLAISRDIPTDPNTTAIPVSQYIDASYAKIGVTRIQRVKIVTNKKKAKSTPTPIGNYNVYTVAYNFLIADYTIADLTTVANNLYNAVRGHRYFAYTLNGLGNPVQEVGDGIAIAKKGGGTCYSYIFTRRLKGIQALRDTYTAEGEEQISENFNSSSYQYKELSSQVEDIELSGGSYGNIDFPEIIRNIGFRLLDEPSNVSLEYDEDNNEVSLKWKDPSDITTNEPCPATWAGTVVVRKENSAPLHRWDGTLIVDSTTRDAYKTTALVDNTVQREKLYYYGIFPYHIWLDDINSPIRHYRYTKIISMGVKGFTFHWLYDGSKPSGQQFPDGLDYDLGNIYVEGYPSTTLPTISSNCILFSDVTHVAEFIVFNERLAPCQTLKVSVEKIANASAQNHNLHIFGGINNSGYEAQNPNYGNESIYNIYDNSIPYVIEGQFYNDDIPLNEVVTLSIPMPISSEGMFICICCSLNVKVYKIWGE